MDQLPVWTRLEEQRLRRLWAKERDRHQKENLSFKTPPPVVRMPPAKAVWASLQHIQGVSARTPHEHQQQTPVQRPLTTAEKTLQQWTTADLYRGISPHSLVQAWEQLFKTKTTVAENLAHRFCKTLEEGIRQAVWKTRCTTLIAWEKQHGITPSRKKNTLPAQPGSVPRAWKTIVGKTSTPGTCECGEDLTRHTDMICPGFTGTSIESDIFLLDSYLGRRRPGVMEKLGGCKFLLAREG